MMEIKLQNQRPSQDKSSVHLLCYLEKGYGGEVNE